jgi:hypothetical protein
MKHPAAVLPLLAAMLAWAGPSPAAEQPRSVSAQHAPMVQDWSTAQALFRDPETPEEARTRGHLARWQRLASDPRFMFGLVRKLEAHAPPVAVSPKVVHRDWANVLGGGAGGLGGSGFPGVYPAKYSFDINAAPNCSTDFVVFGTNAAGANSSGTAESWTGTFVGNPAPGDVLRLGAGNRQVSLSASLANNAGTNFKFVIPADVTLNATNLAAAINRWSGQSGFTATANAVPGEVKVIFGTNGNINDTSWQSGLLGFAVAHTDGTGISAAGQASIIALNQLYDTTCDGTRQYPGAPGNYWAYNTGGTVRTSPVLSYFDGAAQVAFVQSNILGSEAQLVLLKWKEGEGTPGVPAIPALAATSAEYRNGTGACAGGVSCMLRMNFSVAADVSFSSPFVDYFGDALYVGGDDGRLRKFSGVFGGIPAEVTSGGFPALVSSGNALSPPVYDFNGSVFVGSRSAIGSGGSLHRVNASNGAVVSSGKLSANTPNPGILASPMLDVSTGRVYVFVFNDGGAAGTNCTSAPCRAVIDFAGNFAAGST